MSEQYLEKLIKKVSKLPGLGLDHPEGLFYTY